MPTANVLLPVALDRAYTYTIPDGLSVAAGDVVRVELNSREMTGVVWDDEAEAGGKLKPILKRLDVPPFSSDFRRFLDWLARYTLSPRGMALRMALRYGEEEIETRARIGVRFAGQEPDRISAARARILSIASDGAAWAKKDLAVAAQTSTGVIDGLISQGVLERVALEPEPIVPRPDPAHAEPLLNPAQRAAATEAAGRLGAFSTILLEGVTGSGKTETYFEAAAAALSSGRQALILLPEIALTAEFRDRFARRFGAPPAEWHSGLPAKRRARIWRAAAEGEARVVIGARSALFLPFKELGLIVVDEEHDQAYKQEEGVLYNARDMAVARGMIERLPVILSSATPSLETRLNVENGRYAHSVLPSRASGAPPRIEAIDLRREGPERGRWLAPKLVAAMQETFETGEQSLLFLNRRGYAPLTLCRKCGFRFQCGSCSAWLVEHRFRKELRCHHCGYSAPTPEACPKCEAPGSLVACGPGVERVAEEIAERFPKARIVTLSSDVPGGIEHLKRQLSAVANGEADIAIGTQLVAKGHNFPKLTLVGVVDADMGLAQGDPRAAERTFQLLTQVVGRAGRAIEKSRGLIQTYAPELPVMQAILSGDSERFYEVETEERRLAGLPPFGRMAALIVSGEPEADPLGYARALARAAPEATRAHVLGPAEAPLAMLRGRKRFRLLVKAERGFDLQGYLREWFEKAPKPKGSVRLAVDVDPQSFL